MKNSSKIISSIVVIFFCGIIVAAAYIVASRYLGAKTAENKDTPCRDVARTHTATIREGKVSPIHIDAQPCDQLTVVNQDSTLRLMAFGKHDKHVAYGDITEQRLTQGESLTVTLNQAGTFTFHDHLHEEVSGSFTVEQRK